MLGEVTCHRMKVFGDTPPSKRKRGKLLMFLGVALKVTGMMTLMSSLVTRFLLS